MINYCLNKCLGCSYKGIHFKIINHLYIQYVCMKKQKKSNNQSKQRPSPPNNPIFNTILLSIYRILNSALLIVNVSVEYTFFSFFQFPLSSSFQFPSSYLSDHSDPVKMPQLSLNVNHRQLYNHHKTSTKCICNTEAMAEHLASRYLV